MNEVIGVDLLQTSSETTDVPKTLRIHKLALMVNDMLNELERVSNINADLINQIKAIKPN